MDHKKEDRNICINCEQRLFDIASTSHLSEESRKFLSKPKRVLTFSIPVRMDDGSVKTFNAYRVQYNDALGPTKGGIRYHQEVDLEEVKILAFLMTLKTSLAGLPYGGAKGGIEVNPEELSKGELERLTRGFVKEAYKFIGPNTDIPAPDVNTNAETMAWIVDEYSRIKGEFTPAVVTGKPISLGGSLGRETATSLGGAFVLRKYVTLKNLDEKDLRVVIQGFGNVGMNIAKILNDWGYTIIAISNSKGGIFNEFGLNIDNIIKKSTANSQLPEDEGKVINNEEMLLLDCDVLIPAALSNQITKENADKIKASVILEMANAPVTHEADDILENRNIIVLPDILANAGGVIVSYLEWVQNSENYYWKENRVNTELKEIIERAFDSVLKTKEEKNLNFRDASYVLAVNRVLDAEKLKGTLN